MPPKRKRTSGRPSRRTLPRILENEEDAGVENREAGESIDCPPPRATGLSVLSTEVDESNWPALSSQARGRLNKYVSNPNRQHDDKVVPCLSAFLDWLPEGGRESTARDILNCGEDDDALHQVFINLYTGLLYPMKTVTAPPTVISSPHAQTKSNIKAIASTIDEPKSHEEIFRDDCLRRDRYACVVAGQVDINHWEEVGAPEGVFWEELQAAHIIPFAYASWKKSLGPSIDRVRSWEVLYRCFPTLRRVGMKVENINDVSNGIMLTAPMHVEFGKFRCAFVATEEKDVYRLKTYRMFIPARRRELRGETITLKKADGAEDLNLPFPEYLECHHRVAEILNASGMGEIIDKYIQKWENLKASDGAHGCLDAAGKSDIAGFLNAALSHMAHC